MSSSPLSVFFGFIGLPLSLLESNVKILEQDCKVAQLFVDAATSRKNSLYLGLDISTQSTGYAVLRPSTATMGTPVDSSHNDLFFGSGNSHRDEPALLRDVGEANLVEWGYISGTGSDGKKGDEVDVGVIVEETLMQVAARCGRSTGDDASEPSSPPSTGSSEQEGESRRVVRCRRGVTLVDQDGVCCAASCFLGKWRTLQITQLVERSACLHNEQRRFSAGINYHRRMRLSAVRVSFRWRSCVQ